MIGAYERLGSLCFCIYLEVQSLVLIFNILQFKGQQEIVVQVA